MRFFYDCEFIEDGTTIDLVSIGVVGEDGREFYAVSTGFDPEKAGERDYGFVALQQLAVEHLIS